MAKIIGGVAATTMPVPDWNQTDSKKADYIKNKPTNLATTEYVDEAVAGAATGAIYLPANEANYNVIKDYLDKGKTVVIVRDDMHYHCVRRSDSSIVFQSTFLGSVYILDYGEGIDEPYDGGTTLLEYSSVRSDYDPSSYDPISGVGVADALAGVERPWKCIADVTMETDSSINITHDKYFDEFDFQINTLGVPKDNCASGTLQLFNEFIDQGVAFAGLMANGSQYYVIRFHGVLRNGLWEIKAYSKTTNWQAVTNLCTNNFVNAGAECTIPIKQLKLYPYGAQMRAGTKYKLFVKEVADQ